MKTTWLFWAIALLLGITVGTISAIYHFRAHQLPDWAQCPRQWVPLVYGDGHLAGMVCYKTDGSTRTILFR